MRKFVVGAVAVLALGAGAVPADAVKRRAVTPDGTAVAFSTRAALVPADADTDYDVYLWRNGDVELASQDAGGSGGSSGSHPVFVSDDGSRVYFRSDDSLVAEDDDTWTDLYEYSGGTTRLVSGAAPGSGPSYQTFWAPEFDEATADGSRVFFDTILSLVPEDTDFQIDVYSWEAGITTLVSKSSPGDGSAFYHVFGGVSSDGSRVFENTDAPLVTEDVDAASDVYERRGTAISLVSRGTLVDPASDAESSVAAVTPSGSAVTFDSRERLEPNDVDDTRDLYQRSGGRTRLLSANSSRLSPPCPYTDTRYGPQCTPWLSAQSEDGTHTVFYTNEPLVSADANAADDLYDATTSRVEWLSGPVLGASQGSQGDAALSPNGTRRVFEARGSLTPADVDSADDVYVRAGGTATLLSPGGSAAASLVATSRDATRVFFETKDGLVSADTDGAVDVYENSGGTVALVTTGPADPGTAVDNWFSGVSENGQRAFFRTTAPLVPEDTDSDDDLYMRSGGVTTLLTG